MKVECQAKPNFGIVFIYKGAALAMAGRVQGAQLCDFVVKHRAEPELWLSCSDSWFEFGRHHSIGHCSSFIRCALKHFQVPVLYLERMLQMKVAHEGRTRVNGKIVQV